MINLISANLNIIQAYLYSLEELLNNTDYNSAISKSLLKLAEVKEADHAAFYSVPAAHENNRFILRSEYELTDEGILTSDYRNMFGQLALSDDSVLLLKERRASIITKGEISDDSFINFFTAKGILTSIVIPLFRKNNLWGLLILSRMKKGFNIDDEELTLFSRLGGLISNALDQHYDREQKNKLALIARRNRLGVLITDRDLNITYANDSLKKITGYSKPELIGRNPFELMKGPLTHGKGIELLISGHQSSYPVDIDIILYRKDRSWFWANVKQQPINDKPEGENQHFSFIKDIGEKKTAEEYVRNSRRRLTALIQNLQEGILLEDQDQRITLVNPGFCNLFYLPNDADELIGKNSHNVLNEIDAAFIHREAFMDFYKTTVSGGRIVTGKEWTMVNGKIYETDYIPILKNDTVTGHLWKFTDITLRKNQEKILKKQEEKYRNIIANMNLGLVEADTENIIRYANNQFIAMSGLKTGSIEGKKIYDLDLGEHFSKVVKEESTLLQLGISEVNQIRIINGEGEQGWWLVSQRLNYDDNGKLTGSILVSVDITPQKTLENELEIARKKAEESSKAKELFLATVSHEMRTPLNIITGMIREISRESLSEKQKLFIRNAEISSSHLFSIVNNVLDITKIELGQIDLDCRPFSIKEIINETVSIMEIAANEKMLKIVTGISDEVRPEYVGDSKRIRQILLNILDNSVKFTEAGKITIDCTVKETKAGSQTLWIRITDTGTGIEEGELKEIAERFKIGRASYFSNTKGSGLGLPISHELARIMSGDVIVSSAVGKGTTVDIILPLKTVEIDEYSDSDKNLSPDLLRNRKVLLAEDNFLNRLVAINSLSFYGMEVTEAANGRDAIEKLRESSYDLVLMDLQMPEMGGLEATRIIREDMGLQVPVIALTANAFKSEMERCINAGMNDYVIKPFDEKTLISVIVKNIKFDKVELNTNNSDELKKAEKLYDLHLINIMSRGNSDFVKKMIMVFCDQVPEMVKEMKRSWQTGNHENMRKMAHKIKPNLANFSIVTLEKEIKDIEQCDLTDIKQDVLEDAINKVENITEQVKLALQKEL